MPVTTADAKIYQTGFSGLSYTDIGKYLKRTILASEQELVTNLIKEKEFELCSQTNRQFLYTNVEYWQKFNANITKVIPFNTPLNTLTKVEINGVDVTSQFILDYNYFIYDNYIYFKTPLVASQDYHNAVKLTYTIRQFWGDDIKNLLKKWVALEFLASENAGVNDSSRSVSGVNESLDLAGFEKEKREVIFRYIDFEV